MKALFIQPLSHPIVVDIDNDLETITSLLNCDLFENIQIDDNVELLCDEMGFYHPYQLPNRKVNNHWIIGPILLVGVNDDDFDDLSDDMISKYKILFYETEIELGIGNNIHIKESN